MIINYVYIRCVDNCCSSYRCQLNCHYISSHGVIWMRWCINMYKTIAFPEKRKSHQLRTSWGYSEITSSHDAHQVSGQIGPGMIKGRKKPSHSSTRDWLNLWDPCIGFIGYVWMLKVTCFCWSVWHRSFELWATLFFKCWPRGISKTVAI